MGLSGARLPTTTRHVGPSAVSLKAMALTSLNRALTVADIMTSDVITVDPSASIADAAMLMRDHSVGSMLVVDGSRLIGILTERDLVRFAASGTDASTVKV